MGYIVYRKNNGAPLGSSPYPGGPVVFEGDTTDKTYLCAQCGFRCRVDDVNAPHGSAEGDGGVSVSANDPTVNEGCPLCGSLNSR